MQAPGAPVQSTDTAAHHAYHQRPAQEPMASPPHAGGAQGQAADQPVEFNDAINYIKKVEVMLPMSAKAMLKCRARNYKKSHAYP